MSSSIPVESRLIHRKLPWLRRLHVRIGLMLLLIAIVSTTVYWWPRRASFAVRWAGGKVMSHEDFQLQRQLRSTYLTSATSWSLRNQLTLAQWLTWARPDNDVTWMDLQHSRNNLRGLLEPQRFPSLRFLSLNDRQLTYDVELLPGFTQLTYVEITGATAENLARLESFEQLETLELHRPNARCLQSRSLKNLTRLQELMIRDCDDLGGILRDVPKFASLRSFDAERGEGVTDNDLHFLSQLNALQHLNLTQCGPIGDTGLEHLSKLEGLESLVLTGSLGDISDKGVAALSKLQSLKHLSISDSQLNPEQLQKLYDCLPPQTLRVR